MAFQFATDPERRDGRLSKEEFVNLLKNEYGKIKSPEEEEAEILDAFRVTLSRNS